MKIPFEFEPLLIFGWMSAMLLTGVFLRAQVRFFQNYLIPSCLIGGVLGLVLETVGVIRFPAESWESFAYHLFNISFISVGLTTGNDAEERTSADKGYF